MDVAKAQNGAKWECIPVALLMVRRRWMIPKFQRPAYLSCWYVGGTRNVRRARQFFPNRPVTKEERVLRVGF